LAPCVVELAFALAEFGLQLGLRRLGRRGFAQHALAVDVADLQFLRLARGRAIAAAGRQAGGQGLEFRERLHQNAVPIWNWKRWILSLRCTRKAHPSSA
jgi:hypothetical protein